MTIYSDSERRACFYKVGRQDAHRGKFVKAPFDLLLIDGDWCIEAQSIGASPIDTMATYTGPNALLGDDEFDTEAFLMGREEAWHSLDIIVLEIHDMGTLTDNWQGVHQFGFISRFWGARCQRA